MANCVIYNNFMWFSGFISYVWYTCRVLRAMKAFEKEEALIMKDVPGWEVGKNVYNSPKWLPPHPALLKDPDETAT